METESLVLCSGDALDIKFIHEPESIIDDKILLKVLSESKYKGKRRLY